MDKVLGLICCELGYNLSIYKIFELFFELDELVVYGNYIDELFCDLNKD